MIECWLVGWMYVTHLHSRLLGGDLEASSFFCWPKCGGQPGRGLHAPTLHHQLVIMGACEAAAAAACACTRLPPTPALTVASKRPASPVSMPSLKGMAYTGVSCDVREQPCTCSKQLRLHARRLPLKTPAATSSRARLQLFPPHTCSKPEATGNAAARYQPPPAHATQMTIPLIYAMTNADIKIYSDAPRRHHCT